MLSGFIIGLPVFFQVGLVLLAPVLFTAGAPDRHAAASPRHSAGCRAVGRARPRAAASRPARRHRAPRRRHRPDAALFARRRPAGGDGRGAAVRPLHQPPRLGRRRPRLRDQLSGEAAAARTPSLGDHAADDPAAGAADARRRARPADAARRRPAAVDRACGQPARGDAGSRRCSRSYTFGSACGFDRVRLLRLAEESLAADRRRAAGRRRRRRFRPRPRRGRRRHRDRAGR